MQQPVTQLKPSDSVDSSNLYGLVHGHVPEVGDLVVEYLRQLNVEYVFGIPGGAIEPLYNALARSARSGGPKPIVARHETGAAFMADGYARNTGNLGVCCATTGPGATNLITGVASAHENNIPMLVLTAQTALSTFGAGAFQESSCTGVDILSMFAFCTCYNSLVSHVDQVERKLNAAIIQAYQSAAPAHLSIPLDVLRSPSPAAYPTWDLTKHVWKPTLIDQEAVDILCREVDLAKKIVFVIGDDCSEGIGTILEAALLLDAYILTTPHGKGLVSPYHPLFRGVIGFAGHRSADRVLADQDVDTVLAIGTPLSEWATNGWHPNILNDRLIHIESSEVNLTRSPMARLHVRGRISSIFHAVVDHLHEQCAHQKGHGCADMSAMRPEVSIGAKQKRQLHFELEDETKYYGDSTPIKPQRLMRELTRRFPPNTRYLADTGASFAWAIHYLHPFDRRIAGERDAHGGVFRACLEFASMGWAIGSAVGTALARRGEPVVCITGDGALLMSGQEITVAVQEQLPVIYVVLNDAALGMVKHGQRLSGAEPIGYQLPTTDFAGLAKTLGAAGYVITSPQDLHMLDIDHVCKRKGPTLLDVRIDREETPPMGVRIKSLVHVNESAIE